MPAQDAFHPAFTMQCRDARPDERNGRRKPALRRSTALATTALAALAWPGDAAAAVELLLDAIPFTSANVVLLAVFGGAMSFAILAATWLIRERAVIIEENEALKHKASGARAANERLEALVNAGDQCVVMWTGAAEKPVMIGRLSSGSGAPQELSAFVAFGRWLQPESAQSLETALAKLLANADAFELTLSTLGGGFLEARGRTTGGNAFIRFAELSVERSALARLETEHARLMSTFDTIQSLFEKLPMPVWLRDAAGDLYWVNSAYAKAVDCTDGMQAVDRRLQLLDSAERGEVQRGQKNAGVFSGSLPAVVAGDRRTLDYTEVRTGSGYAGIAVDRHEVDDVRAMLRQTTASHAQTLDHLATAIAMFDGTQKLQFNNSSFQKLFGLTTAFLESRPDNAQVLDAMRAEGKLPDFNDWRDWRTKALSIYKAVEAREEWWHLADGRVLRVVANPHNQGGATWVFENVTEQVELRTNYNSLIHIQGETLANLSEAVVVFGPDGKLKLHNPAFGKIWQIKEPMLKEGTHISALAAPMTSRMSKPEIWTEIVGAITGFDESRDDRAGRIETVDGKVVDYALVRLPEGQTMLAVVDMTATVNVERALTERNEALEQADKLKNRFLQHVSLELRAPLTSISGFSEMLKMPEIGRLNEKQHEYVGHITTAAETLRETIDDILDLATVDAGAMALEIETVDIPSVVENCSAELAEQMALRGITLESSIGKGARRFFADRKRFEQILANLLDNAVRHSPDGGKVSVSSAAKDRMVEIAVADDGPGVPLELSETIFKRFEGHNSGERRRGTGLGLSVVKSFVELHGGSVFVENAGERGARFVCRFPSASGGREAA